MRTLSGAEILAPAPGYAAIDATIVKARDVSHLADVPLMAVLGRTRHGNGYHADQMLAGWWEWEDVVGARGGWYALANEPNHSHDQVPPSEWLAEAVEALERIGVRNHGHVLLPGLQPYHRTDEWLGVYERLERLYPGLAGRAIHIYWQGAVNVAPAVAMGLGLRRPGAINVVAEYGDSGHELGIDTQARINATVHAASLMRGKFDALTLFCHNGNGDPAWDAFVFPEGDQRAIVTAGLAHGAAPTPPAPAPLPEPVPPPGGDDVSDANPLNYTVGSGVLARATELGLTIRSDEAFVQPGSGGQYSITETFEGRRLFWSAATGVLVSDPT